MYTPSRGSAERISAAPTLQRIQTEEPERAGCAFFWESNPSKMDLGFAVTLTPKEKKEMVSTPKKDRPGSTKLDGAFFPSARARGFLLARATVPPLGPSAAEVRLGFGWFGWFPQT